MQLPKKKKHKRKKPKRWTPQRIRRNWIEACLALWSILVRHRDKKCIWCGSTNRLQAHHIVSKSLLGGKLAGYLDQKNGMTLCYKCHMHRLKADPDEYIEMRDRFLKRLWKLTYQDLRDKYRLHTKYSLGDISVMYQYDLKAQIIALRVYCDEVEKIENKWLKPIRS